jgi:hypothetical protein
MANVDVPGRGATTIERLHVNQALGAAESATVKAAVADTKYRVLAWHVSSNAATTVLLQTDDDDVAGVRLAGNAGQAFPRMEEGWMETLAGEALKIESTAAATLNGTLLVQTIGPEPAP